MGANRTTFEKLQRDRAKKAKAAAKRARRQGNEPTPEQTAPQAPATTTEWDVASSDEPLSAAELLQAVEKLHAQFESKAISFEEFEERKTDLLARITVD